MASLLESKYRAPKLSKRHSWDLTVLTWAELKQLFWCKPVENTGSLVRRLWANLLMPNLSLGVIGWTITATWLVWDQSVFLCRLGPHNYSSHLNPATFTPASLSGLTLELFFLSGCESQAQKTTKNHVWMCVRWTLVGISKEVLLIPLTVSSAMIFFPLITTFPIMHARLLVYSVYNVMKHRR